MGVGRCSWVEDWCSCESLLMKDGIIGNIISNRLMKTVRLLVLAVLLSAASCSNGFGLIINDATASATTDYIFDITLDGSASVPINVQSGANTAVALPAEYSGRMTSGSYTCTIAAWNTLSP